MTEIQLTQGKVALVDEEDYEWLSHWRWRAQKGHRTYYAVRDGPCRARLKRQVIMMHREISNVPVGLETHHINGNGLDNRRQNVRLATRSLNQRNHMQQKRARKHSLPMGVTHRHRLHSFRARITKSGKCIHLGSFATAEQGHAAYLKARAESIAEAERDVVRILAEKEIPR